MRFFLKTRKFKITLAIIAAIIALLIVLRIIGGMLSPGSGIIGTIIAAFQDMATGISGARKDLGKKFNQGNE